MHEKGPLPFPLRCMRRGGGTLEDGKVVRQVCQTCKENLKKQDSALASLGRSLWPLDLSWTHWGVRINRLSLLSPDGALEIASQARFGTAWAFEKDSGT